MTYAPSRRSREDPKPRLDMLMLGGRSTARCTVSLPKHPKSIPRFCVRDKVMDRGSVVPTEARNCLVSSIVWCLQLPSSCNEHLGRNLEHAAAPGEDIHRYFVAAVLKLGPCFFNEQSPSNARTRKVWEASCAQIDWTSWQRRGRQNPHPHGTHADTLNAPPTIDPSHLPCHVWQASTSSIPPFCPSRRRGFGTPLHLAPTR